MATSRKRFYLISAIVIFAAVSLLIGFLAWQHWALIGQEQAIQNAMQACRRNYGLQPVGQPTKIEAKLAWGGAELEPYIIAPYISDSVRPVWVVKMKGHWLYVSGPMAVDPANPNSQPVYADKCTILINARTGESVDYYQEH